MQKIVFFLNDSICGEEINFPVFKCHLEAMFESNLGMEKNLTMSSSMKLEVFNPI